MTMIFLSALALCFNGSSPATDSSALKGIQPVHVITRNPAAPIAPGEDIIVVCSGKQQSKVRALHICQRSVACTVQNAALDEAMDLVQAEMCRMDSSLTEALGAGTHQ